MPRKLNRKLAGKKGLRGALLNHQKQLQKERSSQDKLKNINKQKEQKQPNKSGQQQNHKPIENFVPFTKEEKVLIIGDGDFSYSLAILDNEFTTKEKIIITSYDSGLNEIKLKYPNSAETNYNRLINDYGFVEGETLLFKVDCQRLIKTIGTKKIHKYFKDLSCIIFNFPHNGRGIKDVAKSIADHQMLLKEYFANCQELYKLIIKFNRAQAKKQDYNLKEVKFAIQSVVVTLFDGEPYVSWAIKTLAKMNKLKLARSGKLNWDHYKGYNHKKTNNEWETTKPQNERSARIYKFDKFGVQQGQKKEKKGDNDSDSDSD